MSLASIVIEFKAVVSQFTEGFQAVQADVKKFNASIENGNAVLTKMGSLFAAFVGFQQLGQSIKDAEDLRGAMAQLEQALRTTGQGGAGGAGGIAPVGGHRGAAYGRA